MFLPLDGSTRRGGRDLNADEVMALIRDNRLSIKETFKLWRMLNSSVHLMPSDVVADMRMREPELFEPELPDSQGYIHFPWHEGYDQLRKKRGVSTPDLRPESSG